MKIHGQPSHTTITKLEEELVQIAIVIPTSLGGGELGHAGLDHQTYKPENAIAIIPDDNAYNVHALPSTPMAIRFLHAPAGFPPKAT